VSTRETNLSGQIDVGEYKAQYDAYVKRILSDKQVLANIMVGVIPEYEGYTIEEAMACIESEPEVAKVRIRPGESIRGVNTESAVPHEGKVTYDIVYTARVKVRGYQKIYINVEAQKNYRPGYDLTTRGIFYSARLLSTQMDTEFTDENYDDIKKVYSIWICMNTPVETNKGKNSGMQVSDSIVKYSIVPEVVYSEKNPEKVFIGRYDLLTCIFVCLKPDETEKSKNKLIGMLSVFLSQTKSATEKKQILADDYGMKMSKTVEEEVSSMCNLSDLIEEKAKIEAIRNMLKFGVSEEKILEVYTAEELAKAKEETVE